MKVTKMKLMDIKEDRQKMLMLSGFVIFIVLLLVSFFLIENKIIFINVLFVGLFILVVPYSLNKYFEFKRMETMERQFPNFLRDLAEANRSGLSLFESFKITSKNNYGPLSDEIKKLSNQLSWNITLDKVLVMFRKRLGKSGTISRSILIMNQTQKSGGNTVEILNALADSIEEITEVNDEKNSVLNQQIIMMYAIFFIFLGITIALIKFLLPLMNIQPTEGFAAASFGFGTNPCKACLTQKIPACMTCETFFAICGVFGLGSSSDVACYFRSLFFVMVLVQAVFSGLISGQIGSTSIIAGIKHSLIMTATGLFIFLISARVGFI